MTPLTAEDIRRDYMAAYRQMPLETPTQMARAFAIEAGIELYDFFGPTRVRPVAHARQDCFLMLRERTDLSLSSIGQIFGRDHTTVLHGIRAAKDRRAEA